MFRDTVCWRTMYYFICFITFVVYLIQMKNQLTFKIFPGLRKQPFQGCTYPMKSLLPMHRAAHRAHTSWAAVKAALYDVCSAEGTSFLYSSGLSLPTLPSVWCFLLKLWPHHSLSLDHNKDHAIPFPVPDVPMLHLSDACSVGKYSFC